MAPEKNSDKLDQVVAQARRAAQQREEGYRAKALKMYPWICGRCAREFTRETLQELTVHHRDHDHANNSADGSNWELLCLYCHDNEHSKYEEMRFGSGKEEKQDHSGGSHNPFAGLGDLLKK